MYRIIANDHMEYQEQLKLVCWQEKNQIPIMVTDGECADGFLSDDNSAIYAFNKSKLPEIYERPLVEYISTNEWRKLKEAEAHEMKEDITNTMAVVVEMQMEQMLSIIE